MQYSVRVRSFQAKFRIALARAWGAPDAEVAELARSNFRNFFNFRITWGLRGLPMALLNFRNFLMWVAPRARARNLRNLPPLLFR